MKKTKALILSLTLLPNQSFAADKILDGLNNETTNQVGTIDAVKTLITNITSMVLNISMVLAVIMIVVGGLVYITSAGNEKQADKGKQFLAYSVIGFIIVIAAKAIFSIFVTLIGGGYR